MRKLVVVNVNIGYLWKDNDQVLLWICRQVDGHGFVQVELMSPGVPAWNPSSALENLLTVLFGVVGIVI
jgi:hypothetical protein